MATNTPIYQGNLSYEVPLARHTSWRVGGVAEKLYKPNDIEDLQHYLQSLPSDEAVTILGLGSNVLIRDGGIRGSVIYTRGRLNKIELVDSSILYVEAGVNTARIAKLATEKGLAGGEFFAGIPGTMGGALTMNAGAFGGETWRLVDKVIMLTKQGQLIERKASEFSVSYRSVSVNADEYFVACYLKIPVNIEGDSSQKIKDLLAKRALTQPTNMPSAGSVFKNPEGDHAARLIEAAGLKGYQIGGAQVSEKHANFIVNTGKAKADDIEQLINYVQQQVLEKHNIQLETEVRILGEQGEAA